MNSSRNKTAVIKVQSYPKFENGKCQWQIPIRFRENDGLLSLGALQKILLENTPKQCLLDLSHVEWADPLPLLYLILLIAESGLEKKAVKINLGDPSRFSVNHRIFLKFLAQQGFLRSIGEFAEIWLGRDLSSDLDGLILHSSSSAAVTHLVNSDFILAKILRVDIYKKNVNQLQVKVEELLDEAQVRAIPSAFGAEPLARDMLFQKVRKLLFELLLNAAEHSHDEDGVVYAGVYARIRSPKPPISGLDAAWTTLFQQDIGIHGQGSFAPNPYTEWLELFICDAGVGLTAHIMDWKIQNDPKALMILRSAIKSKNPLESIASQLFRRPLSRHPRHDTNRSTVTGLQHLGHILKIGGDYGRIYTQQGCWIGDHFPWEERFSYSRKDIRPKVLGSNNWAVSGTAYHFSIQPNHYNLSEIKTYWVQPDIDCRKSIRVKLCNEHSFNPVSNLEIYDRRTANNCHPPRLGDLPSDSPAIVVLRPPRLTSKQDVALWLHLIGGNRSTSPARPAEVFVLADLTVFQMVSLREFFFNVESNDRASVDVILVSEDWCVIRLKSPLGERIFKFDPDGASRFLSRNDQFWIGDLAVLLRQMDSELFWLDEHGNIRDHFFAEPVEWREEGYKDPSIVLSRYLDFPHALSDPACFRACRRALRRCLALFPDSKIYGADDLVESLLREASPRVYRDPDLLDEKRGTLVVGSVAVTAGTANRTLTDTPRDLMHIVVHSDGALEEEERPLAAIIWISDLAPHLDPNSSKNTERRPLWRRIPNSPYIAPGGAQSVPLLRYVRKETGELDFERPLYGRTPEDMYKDFQRLHVLRTGHWRYGKKHDLLTINTRLAFTHSFLELGPMYKWLRAQFAALFNSNPQGVFAAHILVYPSHPVTDAMLDRILQDPGFKDRLPKFAPFPVKFIGARTVSPFIASHLVAYRINKAISVSGLKSWSAAIFDDGVITGKHFRELTQFLHGLGAKQVYTLALVDRSGLPAQEPLVERFLATNKRFWRWDVPTLGNERDCPLCKALAICQTYASRLPAPGQRHRLQQWMKIWATRDIEREWYHAGNPVMSISPPVSITFGVDEASSGEKRKKKLSFESSTSAAAILLELTRLTTKSNAAIKKAKMLQGSSPNASIEIVASQLLLFQDELGTPERYERYAFLLEILWSRSEATHITALAGLCFAIAPREVVERLWSECRETLFRQVPLNGIDAVLAVYILRSRFVFLNGNEEKNSIPTTEAERHNYILLGDRRDARKAIRDFLDIYRNPLPNGGRSTHSTKLRASLTKLQAVSITQNGKAISDLAAQLVRDLRALEQVLQSLIDELLVDVPSAELADLRTLTTALTEDLDRGDPKGYPGHAARISEKLYGHVQTKGLLGKTCNQLLLSIKDADDFDNSVIGEMSRTIASGWKEHLKAKEQQDPGRYGTAVSFWATSGGGGGVTPKIYCSSSSECDEQWVYFDTYAKNVVEGVLSNVLHSAGEIQDPWAPDDKPDGARGHLWWKIEVLDDFLVFSSANLSASKEITLKHTLNIAALERVGGKIDVNLEDVSTNLFTAFTVLQLPLHYSFLKEDI